MTIFLFFIFFVIKKTMVIIENVPTTDKKNQEKKILKIQSFSLPLAAFPSMEYSRILLQCP